MHHEKDVIFFRHGPGEPGPGGPWGGPGDFFTMRLPGPPGMRGMRRGRRIRRGDVRAAILLLVEEEPRNGYQIMQELESRSGGVWRPSPGSVYPALQLLSDEGMLKSEPRSSTGEGGGNVFDLTDAGKAHVEENRERFGSPWQQAGADVPEGVRELGGLMAQVGIAVRQVMTAGTEAQIAQAAQLLTETRRSIYRLLADDAPPATSE